MRDLHHPKKVRVPDHDPPYGERLEDKKDLPELYRALGEAYRRLDSWSAYMITSYEDAEKYFGRKADKNRKIYNGMLKTYFYQFQGQSRQEGRKARNRDWVSEKERIREMDKIIFATGNAHKMVEIRMILKDLAWRSFRRQKPGSMQMW